jgi:parallel beta-helix repeat protein
MLAGEAQCLAAQVARLPDPALPGDSNLPGPNWIQLYVATDGDDRWSGQYPRASIDHADGPFATLERARRAIRELNQTKRVDAGVVVFLRGGPYARTETFILGAADGGTPERPVVYRAQPGERPVLSGAKIVTEFAQVTDRKILDRLDKTAVGHVLAANLRSQGITDFGEFSPQGFHRPMQPAPLELFFRDQLMPLAHWPDSGFTLITGVPAGTEGRFTFDNDRLARWANSPDVWMHGYWKQDWADSYEKIQSIDLAKHEIITAPPHSVYGYAAGKRFLVMNVIEELTQPGEWYLDRQTGMLYFWPPEPIHDGDVVVSQLSKPMVEISGASNVVIRGIGFENSRACGIIVTGGAHNRIVGCTFANLGTFAISIGDHGDNLTEDLYANPALNLNGGTDNGIISCDIGHMGQGGILLGGGDRPTLTPAGNFAINNHISDYARWVRTYRPAIFVSGVGNRASHNLIENAPHVGIVLKGNDHVVEYNDIARVCDETADAGAIYMGRDFTERGNVIRFNMIRQCGAAGAYSSDVDAIYLDDCSSGTLVYGNVIYKCGRGIGIGGGRDNTIDNNILVDCDPAIIVDARGIGSMKFFFDGTNPVLGDRLNLMHYDKPPYGVRYPQLCHIMDEEPAVPRGNKIQHNIRLGGEWLTLPTNCDASIFTVRDNFSQGDPELTAPDKLDFRPATTSPVWAKGFRAIPMQKIGLQKDEYRSEVPERN